jgi:hypothetical protein
MTSPFAKDAVVTRGTQPHYLEVTAEQRPLQGQVPLGITVLTANGALPVNCPECVVVSGAAVITIDTVDLANLVGREVTVCSDNVNAVAHIIQFPANSIGGGLRRATFAANSAASATFIFRSLTQVVVKALHQAVLS